MNTIDLRHAFVALAGAIPLSLPGTSLGADAAGACKTLDPMRASVMAKADQGVDALRRYVYITRAIHQLDMVHVGDSIEAWRAEAGCARRTAERADVAPQVALQSRP